VGPFGAELTVAFDASGVCGAVVSRGWRGRRLRSFARVALPAGALVPQALDPNLIRGDDVLESLRRLVDTLEAGAGTVSLLLPDGVARLGLVDVPPGVDAEEYARFRWAQSLPYPAEEAIVDVLPLEPGRAVAAAVRRRVAEGYEQAAARAGLSSGRVDLAPLAVLSALVRHPPREPAGVDVILGDAAYCLAATYAGTLRALRNRRRDRDEGEAGRLRREVDRTAALAGNGSGPWRVRVTGPGSASLIAELQRAGHAVAPWSPAREGLLEEARDVPWLAAVLQ